MLLSPALALLIALAPSYGIIGGDTSIGLLAAVAAVSFASTRGRGPRLGPLMLVVLLTPLAWMVAQLMPAPLGWFSNPVWASTSSALNLPIAGSISVDTGSTLLAVAMYCAVLATGLTVAARSSDKRSAIKTLYLLAAMAATIAATDVARNFGYFRGLKPADSALGSVFVAVIGIVASCSLLILLRGQLSRKSRQRGTKIAFIGTTAGLILCTVSLLIAGDDAGLFAAFFGAGAPLSLFVIRTWSLRMWGRLGLLATASMALIGFLAVTPMKTDADPALALSRDQSPAAELLLSSVPPLGTGAGSVQDVLPVYRGVNASAEFPSITTAAVIASEMGKSFFWLLIVALAIAAAALMKSASTRRRNYVYAAGGAGILLVFSLLVFVDRDVLGLPSSLLAGIALGLASAQARPDEDTRFARDLAGTDPSAMRNGGARRRRTTRFASGAFTLFLAVQACWILIPSFYLSRGSSTALVSAAARNDNLDKAASIARVRGDLWGKSALAHAAFAEEDPAVSPDSDRVRDQLIKALVYAPYQPKVWLKFAQLADRLKWTRYNDLALLKMVYYTGASEIDVVPSRTKLALRLDDAVADFELRDMIKRDVELILRQRPELTPSLVEAYKSATPAGRALAASVIARLEPGLLSTLRD